MLDCHAEGLLMTTFIVYALTYDRTRKGVERVLDHFIVLRRPCTDEYEYPQYADAPERVYMDDVSILDRIETENNASYSLYWNVIESKDDFRVEQAIVVYTSDGAVLIGMVVPETHATSTLVTFQREFAVPWGLITGDECPTDSAIQFQDICKNADLPHIAEGELIL